MNDFRMSNFIFCATDLKGIAVVNKKTGKHFFFRYPEAAVWSVLSENYKMVTAEKMLRAILNKNPADTKSFIITCIQNWKRADLIE